MRNSIFIAIAILLVSCKDKEAEKLKKEQEKEKHQKEKAIELNKDFMYSCAIIASKTQISIENVQLVLKEYFQNKKYFVFSPNSFVVLNDNSRKYSEKHKLDLIKETAEKYAIPFDNVIKIYCEFEYLERIDDLENQIYSLDCTIQDLESEIDKKD